MPPYIFATLWVSAVPARLAARIVVGAAVGLLLLGPLSGTAASLDGLLARHGFAAGDVAAVVEDVASGRRLIEHRAAAAGPPASTLKLVTAWAALETLGAEYRFATRLWLGGPLSATGVLEGDLVLEGGGDPLLDIDGLMTLAWALREAGIRRIAGRFVLDDSAIPRLPVINPNQPVEAGYNAGIGALSLAFNRVERRPAPGVGWFTVPTLRERGLAWTQLPFDGPASVPVQDPGLHAAWVFRDLAQALAIELDPPIRARRPDGLRLLADVPSRPLRDIVQAMLLYSNNQVAEILGFVASGAASLPESAQSMARRLEMALPTVDWRDFAMTNHSGLDPAASASPDQLLAILVLAESSQGIIALLPASGWSGSLQTRLRTPDAALRVWAKTGSLDFAVALVGYVLPHEHGPRRIALLISDKSGRVVRDAVEVPGPVLRRAIDDFADRARELRDDLVRLALTLAD